MLQAVMQVIHCLVQKTLKIFINLNVRTLLDLLLLFSLLNCSFCVSLKLNIYMAWQKKKKNRQILRLCRHHLMGAVLICQIFHFIIGPAVLGLSGYSDKRNSVDSPFSLWSLIMCDNNDTNPIIRAHPIFCNIY